MKTLSKQILAYAISYQGQWHRIAKALKNQEPYQEVPCPYPYVTIGDANYPLCFRKLRYPPFIIFIKEIWLCWKKRVLVLSAPASARTKP